MPYYRSRVWGSGSGVQGLDAVIGFRLKVSGLGFRI